MSTPVDNAWLAGLLAGRAEAAPREWLNALRGDALEHANRLTVPTTRDEDWRFTDLSPLYKLAFGPARSPAPLGAALEPYAVPEAASRLVFVDGEFAPALSSVTAGGALAVSPLAAAFELGDEAVRAHLGRIASFEDDAFRAINTAHLHEGALVRVGRNHVASAPVHVLFVATQAEIAVHPRVLVIAETGADVTLIEDYVGWHDDAYCVNAVTEVAAAPNARVRHVRLQREGAAGFHIATTAVRLERDARYESNSIALGARISRHNVHVLQVGDGTHCTLDGLALIGGRQLADTHSLIDHAKPHGTSRQLHKCVVAGNAHAVFNGRVVVRRGAQLTDSAQENRNLLLSQRAHVDTKPQLEIFADDVKCAHGATVGQLEAEELFYLRSRGLDDAAARNLLTYGFAAEIVDRISLPSVVANLRKTVLDHTQNKD